MKEFAMRYGVFSVLAVMVAGMVWIARYYDVRVKQPVCFVMVGDGCRIYIPTTAQAAYNKGDTICVSQTPYGDFSFVADSVFVEKSHNVIIAIPIGGKGVNAATCGDSYMEGFVFMGKEKISDMALRKLGVN